MNRNRKWQRRLTLLAFCVGLIESGIAQAPNDSFDAPIDLGAAVPVSHSGTTAGATYTWPETFGDLELEVDPQTVWFEWTPPANGDYFLEVNFFPDRGVAIFSGDTLDTLRKIPLGFYGDFKAVAGETIKIWIASGADADFDLAIGALTVGQRPPNDDFADRTTMPPGTESSIAGTTRLASLEPGERPGFESVWYSWTAPVDGLYSVGGFIDANVYRGSALEDLHLVNGSNLNPEDFYATAGEVFQIAVVTRSSAPNFTLELELVPDNLIPPNDHFSDAEDLGEAASLSFETNVSVASSEAAEYWKSLWDGKNRSVWYSWTAPADGRLVLEATDNLRLDAYTGDHIDALKPLRASEDSRSDKFGFECEAGQTYSISVTGPGFPEENSTVTLKLTPDQTGAPANDHFENATNLGAIATAEMRGSDYRATRQLGEPGANGGTTWWRWTSPFSGEVEATRVSLYQLVPVTAFQGDSLAELEELPELAYDTWRVIEGESYVFQIGATWDSTYWLRLARSEASGAKALADQAFDDRVLLLDEEEISVDGNFDSTHPSYGSVAPFDSDGARARWYEWQAPVDGVYRVNVGNSLFNFFGLYGVVYTGSNLGDLQYVAGGDFLSSFLFAATAGQSYLIAAKNSRSSSFGTQNFTLTLSPQSMPPVAGDSISEALDLGGVEDGFWTVHNVGAGIDQDEPGRDLQPGAASIWLMWTAPVAGYYQFQTVRRRFATIVLENFIGANPETLQPDPSSVISVEAGEVRYVRLANLGGRSRNAQSGFGVTLTHLPNGAPPGNDQFLNAFDLSSAEPVNVRGSVAYATREAGEPEGGAHSAWWHWVAPSDGRYEFAYAHPSHIEVFAGSALDQLELVSIEGSFGRTPTVFPAHAGRTYSIRASSPIFSDVVFEMRRVGELIANDSFIDAEDLGNSASACWLSYPAIGSGREIGEPSHPSPIGEAGVSTWYRWQAPADGLAEVISSSNTAQLAIYEGDSLAGLSVVGGLHRTEASYFRASAGKVYHLVRFDSSTDETLLSIRLGGSPRNNDDFMNAKALPAHGGIDFVAANWGATGEPAEPTPALDSVYPNSLWWSWTAPAAGEVQVSLAGGSFSAVVGVYEGSSLAGLVEVANVAEPGDATFGAELGVTYYISISGAERGFGSTHFSLRQEASLPAFERWLQGWPGLVGADAERGADPDFDGFPNLVELALGQDPTTADPAIIPFQDDGGAMAIEFALDISAMDGSFGNPIELVTETSGDLVSWREAALEALGAGRFRALTGGTIGREFLRLNAIDPNVF